MGTRWLALILALALAAGLLCGSAAAAEWESAIHAEQVVEALKDFFAGAEGDYGSVNRDDNGALSLGLLQWHGDRALALVRTALERCPITANYLTPALYREITDPDTRWSGRTLTVREAGCLSALLSCREGRRIQDEEAAADILGYIADGWAAGMRTDRTVVYFATIRNQFGPAGAVTYMEHVRAAMGLEAGALFYDLEELHRGVHNTLSYGQRYLVLRDKTYDYIQTLAWPREPDPRAAARVIWTRAAALLRRAGRGMNAAPAIALPVFLLR